MPSGEATERLKKARSFKALMPLHGSSELSELNANPQELQSVACCAETTIGDAFASPIAATWALVSFCPTLISPIGAYRARTFQPS